MFLLIIIHVAFLDWGKIMIFILFRNFYKLIW